MARSRRKRPLSPGQWEKLPDRELMRLRIRDLGLRIEDSPLNSCIRQLYGELAAKGLRRFRPPCYLTREWLSPDRVPRIGIPFYLAHRRLVRLERKMMGSAEGGDRRQCMRLLRHEAGHTINYAYRLYRRARWRRLFGDFSAHYSVGRYRSGPSRNYVLHLADHYAQAHPDEDFAETFAVWLTPGGHWRRRYRLWPAILKLQYVDRLMNAIGGRSPLVASGGRLYWPASRMTSTLGAFYRRRRRANQKGARGKKKGRLG